MTFPIFAHSGLGLWSSLGFSISNLRWGRGRSHLAYSKAVAVTTPFYLSVQL